MIDLRQGDCLEIMKDIPDKSIDMILCDLQQILIGEMLCISEIKKIYRIYRK